MKYLLVLFFPFLLCAENNFTVCTQNLYNYGEVKAVAKRTKKSARDLDIQKKGFVKLFVKADCDVIAVQELIGNKLKEVELVLKNLTNELNQASNKNFTYQTGNSNDIAKLGFLYSQNKFRKTFSRSYSKHLLPKINYNERNRYFSRGPLRLDLENITTSEKYSFYNIHFKSQSSFHLHDSSGYKFEFDRMQMAQALKDIASSSDSTTIILGDRNSKANSASANILFGKYDLNYFKENLCKLSDSREARCRDSVDNSSIFYSTFYNDPDIKDKTLIDDIIIDRSNSFKGKFNAVSKFDFNTGMFNSKREVSDHPLLWLKLNKSKDIPINKVSATKQKQTFISKIKIFLQDLWVEFLFQLEKNI